MNKQQQQKYSHASHIDKVLKASKAPARQVARAVLQEACRRAEFDKPETTFTREQIEKAIRAERKSVQRGLKFLKDEGSLLPIRKIEGGRGNAVTYRLQAIGQGGESAAPEVEAGAGGGDPDAVTTLRVWYEAMDPAGYQSWIKALEFEEIAGGVLVLKAPSSFHAAHVMQHMGDRLQQIAANLPDGVRKVKVRA